MLQPNAEQPLLGLRPIDVGSSGTPEVPFLGAVTVAGQAVLPGDLINIGPWLRLVVGATTTSGNSNFIHIFGSGATSVAR